MKSAALEWQRTLAHVWLALAGIAKHTSHRVRQDIIEDAGDTLGQDEITVSSIREDYVIFTVDLSARRSR
mgnify:CR=1 FL=1